MGWDKGVGHDFIASNPVNNLVCIQLQNATQNAHFAPKLF